MIDDATFTSMFNLDSYSTHCVQIKFLVSHENWTAELLSIKDLNETHILSNPLLCASGSWDLTNLPSYFVEYFCTSAKNQEKKFLN